MKKKILALLMLMVLTLSLAACSSSLPIIGDFIESENSLGKTNNTAVAIADAMKDYLSAKKKSSLALYGVEMILNNDGNGIVKLYYTGAEPESVKYADITVAEVDSKTGHVERFSSAVFNEDGAEPYELVKKCAAFDAGSLPIDSDKAVTIGVRSFSNNLEFHYDYVQILLSASGGIERYEIRFISMLNDAVYSCTIDAVSGAVLASSVGGLE